MADDDAAPGLHPLLAGRGSPTTFDPRHEPTGAEVELLIEAARWAPSAGNAQPWAFVVGRRGDATHGRLVRHLASSSALWAPTVQAHALDLHVRQFRAFDRAGIAAEFDVPGHWEVTTLSAVGRAGAASPAGRGRRPREELLWPDGPPR